MLRVVRSSQRATCRDGDAGSPHGADRRSGAGHEPSGGDAGCRPCQCDGQVCGCAGRIRVEFGHAAEHPQGDGPHRDPVVPRHQRVCELVCKQRCQDQNGAGARRGPVQCCRLVPVRSRQHRDGQELGDEDQDDGD
jgi:hypothetical protein